MWHFLDNGSSTPDPHNNATACRFDADGQLTNPCDNGAPQLAYDGNNVIATRAFGVNGSTWRFVHGPGTDDPLLGWWRSGNGLTKLYFWVTDGQGRQLTVGDSVGILTSDDMTLRFSPEGGGKYAGGTGSANSFDADRFSTPEMPGLSLFRNRAYDQRTGRWTQEDPIGVPGGLNLYQFNGNNPVTFSDPFGLDPCKLSGNCTQTQDGRDLASAHINQNDAGRAALQQIHARSVAEDREYGGEIKGNGPYIVGPARAGDQTGVDVLPRSPGTSGVYHSHGADPVGGRYENFSGDDKAISDRNSKPAFLVTPSGEMKRYDPDPNYPQSNGNGAVTDLGQVHP